jgi:hypothetical protein
MTCHPMAACVREPNPPAGFPSQSHKEHRLAVLGRGVQPAVHDIVEQSGQAGLAWERLGAAVDQVDDIGIDIEADDVMTLACELDGQRQTNLAKRDNGYLLGADLGGRRHGRRRPG